MPPTNDDAVARLLDPVGLDAFLADYWERRPLHLPRGEGTRFAALVPTDELERLIASGELTFPDAQLARADAPVAPEAYTDAAGRIVPLRLLQHHADGASLVLSGAQRRFAGLGALCRELGTRLGMRCQTNVYRSEAANRGAASRGFGVHHDSHDVFILQLAGAKTFRFHAGGPSLPLPEQRFDPDVDGGGADEAPSEAIALEAGDTLYIPRGVRHDALASGGEASLHVTLGLFPVTVRDVLQEALHLACAREVALRRAVPIGDGGRDALDPTLLERAFAPALLEEALSRLRDEVAIDALPDGTGVLGRLERATRLTLDDHLALRAGLPASVERERALLRWRVPGQVLEFDASTAAAAASLLGGARVRVGDLAGLDDGRRLALARRLVRENVVDVV